MREVREQKEHDQNILFEIFNKLRRLKIFTISICILSLCHFYHFQKFYGGTLNFLCILNTQIGIL